MRLASGRDDSRSNERRNIGDTRVGARCTFSVHLTLASYTV